MTRMPDEIKKGLECHFEVDGVCDECPYNDEPDCTRLVYMDALAYIQRLEAERDAAVKDMHEAQACLCLICKNYKRDQDGNEIGCKVFGDFPFEDSPIICGQFEWRGVQKEE